MNVLAISGSLRAESSNAVLVQVIAALASPEVSVTVFDALGEIPLFSPDMDTDEPPPSVVDLRSQLDGAEAVLICTPEYAYGMPGSLKNALDWLVSSATLYQKPIAALSASPSERGGDRALAWLLQTLSALDANVPDHAAFPVSIMRQEIETNRIKGTALEQQLSAMFRSLRAAVRR